MCVRVYAPVGNESEVLQSHISTDIKHAPTYRHIEEGRKEAM